MASENAEPRSPGSNGVVRGVSRFARFMAGLTAGLLVLPFLGILGLAGMYATTTVGGWFAPAPPTGPWVEVKGQDVSTAGGVRMVFEDDSQLLRLDCRDGCDDVVETGGPAERLEVRNAVGECVACRRQDGGSWWGKSPKTWLVKGRPLAIEEGRR